jgi:hypothetical protein
VKQLLIQNFYKSKNGKVNAVSFHPSRNITQLLHEYEIDTHPDHIVQSRSCRIGTSTPVPQHCPKQRLLQIFYPTYTLNYHRLVQNTKTCSLKKSLKRKWIKLSLTPMRLVHLVLLAKLSHSINLYSKIGQWIEQLDPLLAVYDLYTGVSGKSSALCINSSPELIHELKQCDFTTPDTMRYLSIEVGKTIEDIMRETLQKIDTKALQGRILATIPPTDILQRQLSLLVSIPISKI